MKILYANAPLLTGRDTDTRLYWHFGEVINGGIKKPNGKYLSIQPDGSYEERDAVGGPYEQIVPAADLNVLVVKPRNTTFKVPFVEQ
jgi:hypothetical protein